MMAYILKFHSSSLAGYSTGYTVRRVEFRKREAKLKKLVFVVLSLMIRSHHNPSQPDLVF